MSGRQTTLDRKSTTSPLFARTLYSVLGPHLPSFPYPASAIKQGQGTNAQPRKPHSFNSNIRLYKYTPTQHFGPHYDDSVRDPETGAQSEWTLLVYLTGAEDGVQGGEVKGLVDSYCICILTHDPFRRPSTRVKENVAKRSEHRYAAARHCYTGKSFMHIANGLQPRDLMHRGTV